MRMMIVLLVVPLVLAALLWIGSRRASPVPARMFLRVAALSSASFPLLAFLHNAVEAVFDVEEPVFFLLAVIGAPAGVLAGIVGAAVAAAVDRRPPGAASTGTR